MSTPVRPPCAGPLDVGLLMDYWRAALDPAQEEAVEMHLFSCDVCGDRLRQMMVLADGLRDLARAGTLRVVVGSHFPQHVSGGGRQVRVYTASPGESVPCTVSADDDHLVGRLGADLAGAERIDLSFGRQGVELARMQDIPVNAGTGSVVYQESIDFAKTGPDNVMLLRLLAVDAAGGERLLGEYIFNHTRTIPGPPGWEF